MPAVERWNRADWEVIEPRLDPRAAAISIALARGSKSVEVYLNDVVQFIDRIRSVQAASRPRRIRHSISSKRNRQELEVVPILL